MQEELIGRNFEPLCHPLDHATCSIVSYYSTLGPAATLIGQVFNATPLMTTKDGRMLRTQGRCQYFYGNSGRVHNSHLFLTRFGHLITTIVEVVYQIYRPSDSQ